MRYVREVLSNSLAITVSAAHPQEPAVLITLLDQNGRGVSRYADREQLVRALELELDVTIIKNKTPR